MTRILHKLTAPFSVLLIAFCAWITLAPPAQAFFLPDTCVVESRGRWVAPPAKQWSDPSGLSAAESPVGRSFVGNNGITYNYGATAREWFGGSVGLDLTSHNFVSRQGHDANPATKAACESGFINGVASRFISWFWAPAMGINDFASNMLEMSQTASIIPWFTDSVIPWIQQGKDTNGDGKRDGAGLNDAYFGGLVIVFAITIGYAIVLATRGRFKNTGKNIFWTVGAVGVSGVLLANPTVLPNAGQLVASNIGTAFSAVASSVVRAVGDDANTNWCTLGESVNYPNEVLLNGSDTPVPSKAVRQITCDFWDVTAVSNWRLGQFGTREGVMTVDAKNWSKSSQDPTIAVNIPGLTTQPAAGDLAALHLSSHVLSPDEQRWRDAYIAANPGLIANADVKLSGGLGAEDSLYEDNPEASYPAGEIYAAGAPAGAYSLGRQQRFEALIDRISDQPGDTYISWSGVGDSAPGQRFLAFTGLAATSLTATLSVGVFSIITVYFQFLFGLMVAFLPLALLGMSLPFRMGTQVTKDYFSKLAENIILVCLGMVFAVGAVFTSVVLPNLFLGDSLGGEVAAFYLRPLIAAIGLVALLVAWNKARKGFRSKVPQWTKANPNSMWDVGSKVAEKTGKGVKAAAVVGGAVALGAATGGTAGVALAAKGVARQAASAAVYGGSPTVAATRGASAHLKGEIAERIPGGDDEELRKKIQERSDREKRAAAAARAAGRMNTTPDEARKVINRAHEDALAEVSAKEARESEDASIEREARIRVRAREKQLEANSERAPLEPQSTPELLSSDASAEPPVLVTPPPAARRSSRERESHFPSAESKREESREELPEPKREESVGETVARTRVQQPPGSRDSAPEAKRQRVRDSVASAEDAAVFEPEKVSQGSGSSNTPPEGSVNGG